MDRLRTAVSILIVLLFLVVLLLVVGGLIFTNEGLSGIAMGVAAFTLLVQAIRDMVWKE